MKLSTADRRLLNALQNDATRSQSELADFAGMSRTSCWRRIRDFEKAGLIERQVAILDPAQVGLQIQVLLAVPRAARNADSLLSASTLPVDLYRPPALACAKT